MLKQKTIKVLVDKSHLLTLGERMYIESIELLRELVNNTYDADATKVFITILPEEIKIEDDGSGMSQKGLEQFFTVGSEEKRIHSISPRFVWFTLTKTIKFIRNFIPKKIYLIFIYSDF